MTTDDDPTKTMTINDPVEYSYDEVEENNLSRTSLLMIETKRLAKVSKMFKEKASLSKTKTKKDFYLKKLRKNNDVLGDMLVRLNHEHTIKNNKTED